MSDQSALPPAVQTDCWPFAMSRGRTISETLITVPEFLLSRGGADWLPVAVVNGLGDVATQGNEAGTSGELWALDPQAGPLTVLFTLTHATYRGDEARDEFSRPIWLYYGAVVNGYAEFVSKDSVLDNVREAATVAFDQFFHVDDPSYVTRPSTPCLGHVRWTQPAQDDLYFLPEETLRIGSRVFDNMPTASIRQGPLKKFIRWLKRLGKS